MPLGRFVERIVVVSSPGANLMRSAAASVFQASGLAVPCAVWISWPAASSAFQTAVRHAPRSPPPQKRVLNGCLNCVPRSCRRSLSIQLIPPPVKLGAPFLRALERLQVGELRAERAAQHRVVEVRVERVHDRGRGARVHEAVLVAIEARRAVRPPRLEQLEHALGARARRRPAAQQRRERRRQRGRAQVLRRRRVHRARHRGEVVLGPAGDLVLQQRHAVQRAVGPVVVRGAEAGRRAVVPVEQRMPPGG